jgi:hypothetical protein
MNSHKKLVCSFFDLTTLVALSLILVSSGCSSSSSPSSSASSSSKLPLLTPIIKSAIPSGLGGTYSAKFLGHLLDNNDNGGGSTNNTNLSTDIGNLQSRFFSGAGPTEIVGQLMPTLDTLIGNINTLASQSTSACLTQTPVSYNINPAGQTIQMYAQCYVTGTAGYSGDPAFTQFGITSTGTIYIYSAQDAEWVAAIVTPLGSGAYTVIAYLGVGYMNAASMNGGCSATPDAWDAGSYGLIELSANSSTGTFELTTAGSGLGFCGAQLVSNGTSIYAVVSNDMGTTCGTSGASDDLCVSAADVTTASSTNCPTAANFTLSPIGRVGGVSEGKSNANSCTSGLTYGASTYPASPNVTFNGTSSDSLHFGPTTPTTGTGMLMANSSGGTPTQAQIASAIETGGSGGCTISSSAANTAASAALAAINGGNSAAISALDNSLTSSGFSSQITCANTAVQSL